MESDPIRHDWIHHHQHGRNNRPDHRPAQWFYPSWPIHRLQPNASFRRRQSCHIPHALSKLGWINQEVLYLRFDLYVLPLLDIIKLIRSHGVGKWECHCTTTLLGTMGSSIYQLPVYSLGPLLVLYRHHTRYPCLAHQEEQEKDRRSDSGGWNCAQYQLARFRRFDRYPESGFQVFPLVPRIRFGRSCNNQSEVNNEVSSMQSISWYQHLAPAS